MGTNYLQAYASNLGEVTFYRFTFAAQTEIKENAFLEAIFPMEFSVFAFPSDLECSVKVGILDFVKKSCTYSTGNIIRIELG